MREGCADWDNDFWQPLEKYMDLGRGEQISI
jgi:hypothetical protein